MMLEDIKRIRAIAEIGLLYAQEEYDLERYRELHALSFSLMSALTGHSHDDLQVHFPLSKDYPTAKVDIRGLLVNENGEILLVRESADGKWSLPGGWADIGNTPRETIVRELKEETGLDIVPRRLLAVFDKKMHLHPPQPFYVYKMVFHCEALSTGIQKGFDVLDVAFFPSDQLPELSENRILKSQIELVYQKVKDSDWETFVD